ncbi:MAG: ABC transporter ATP-binding protein [Acidobacteriota bacterium]|nr:MAG: ABC transporter ATP-binding protein [Acidobacteriota bacterium]
MTSTSDAFIQLRGVSKSYRRGGELLQVLNQLDLDIVQGDFAAMMGPSGSGKTTILNLVGGLDNPDAGQITVAGVDITRIGSSALPAWRARHVGFVFQSFNLVSVLTALENVLLPLKLTPLGAKQRREQARFALEIVGLADRMKHRPKQLSGGQEQRVAIARAIATDPDIILAEEPTGDLDRDSANEIMKLLGRLNDELGKTILMVTHDQLAADHARRVLHLDKGELIEKGVIETPGSAT